MKRALDHVTCTSHSVLSLCIVLSVFTVGRCMLESSASEEDYGFGVSNDLPSLDKSRGSKVFHDNGMLYLILHELALEFIRELQEIEQIPLSEHQQKIIEERIKGFYRRIVDHPALGNENVIYAPKHPDFEHLIPANTMELSHPSDRIGKRNGPFEVEACPSTSQWKQYTTGETQNFQVLELYGDQYFWITTCEQRRSRCRHISSGHRSHCMQKTAWVLAYLINSSDRSHKWDWISVPSCCSCVISTLK
ncbi:hypothetical protein HOLleu_26081 [Holothuria leucospilota]|uniref:Spaetzle domain-containing protein n=1 Tax=Holothuria leucospilota TaxID=206669 RepID=A0A9Q1BTK8_HOLLE|nr:hypothetical protein HOLleu_26081 [Holothuria leucospilota]